MEGLECKVDERLGILNRATLIQSMIRARVYSLKASMPPFCQQATEICVVSQALFLYGLALPGVLTLGSSGTTSAVAFRVMRHSFCRMSACMNLEFVMSASMGHKCHCE